MLSARAAPVHTYVGATVALCFFPSPLRSFVNTNTQTYTHTHTLAACFLGQRLVAARLCFKRQQGRQQQHEIGGHLNAEGMSELHCAK